MSNLDTFYCPSCGCEFVVKPASAAPVCPSCGAELKFPALTAAASRPAPEDLVKRKATA
jgi:ribosomal protein L37AE/L43A